MVIFHFGNLALEVVNFVIAVILAVLEVATDEDGEGEREEEDDKNSTDQAIGHDPEREGAGGHQARAVGGGESGAVAPESPDRVPSALQTAGGKGEDVEFLKGEICQLTADHVTDNDGTDGADMGVGLVFDDRSKVDRPKLKNVRFDREVFDQSVVFEVTSYGDAKEGANLGRSVGDGLFEAAARHGLEENAGVVAAGEGIIRHSDEDDEGNGLFGGEH